MYPNPEPSPPLPVLPIDIIIEIFYKLPVKTLLRLKSLSKQFHSLIDSPDFINRHLQHKSSYPKLCLLAFNGARQSLVLLTADSLNITSHMPLPSSDIASHLPILSVDYGNDIDFINYYYKHISLTKVSSFAYHASVIGSCDGLAALLNALPYNVVIFNISTRKYKILRSYLFDSGDPYRHYSGEFVDDGRYGFGRGGSFDDYKVVRVSSFKKPDDLRVTTVSVYSLKTESWKTICDISPSFLLFQGKAVFLPGSLNWLVYGSLEGSEEGQIFILSFDLKNDNISSILLFDTGIATVHDLYLHDKGECLCLLENLKRESLYNVWVMEEFGVKESWTKLYTLSLSLSPFSQSFVISKDGDKAFMLESPIEVAVLNMDDGSHEFTKQLPGIPSGLCVAVESLVSPQVNI